MSNADLPPVPQGMSVRWADIGTRTEFRDALFGAVIETPDGVYRAQDIDPRNPLTRQADLRDFRTRVITSMQRLALYEDANEAIRVEIGAIPDFEQEPIQAALGRIVFGDTRIYMIPSAETMNHNLDQIPTPAGVRLPRFIAIPNTATTDNDGAYSAMTECNNWANGLFSKASVFSHLLDHDLEHAARVALLNGQAIDDQAVIGQIALDADPSTRQLGVRFEPVTVAEAFSGQFEFWTDNRVSMWFDPSTPELEIKRQITRSLVDSDHSTPHNLDPAEIDWDDPEKEGISNFFLSRNSNPGIAETGLLVINFGWHRLGYEPAPTTDESLVVTV